MDSSPFSQELHIASLAVQRASLLTKLVAEAADKGAMEKTDASIVTIADFAAQALLISALHRTFPDDGFLGEESAAALRSNCELQDRVWALVSSTKLDDQASEALLATPSSKEELLEIISLGKKTIPNQRETRFWILDPIDGTTTFLQGQQYAICLALVEDGKQKIGVLGCPNLNRKGRPIQEDLGTQNGYGLMLFAIAGMGAYARPMSTGNLEPACRLEQLRGTMDAKELRFIESATHPAISPDKHRMVAQLLGIPWPGTELWAMQMKYVALALGEGEIVIRIPRNEQFRPYVWDHAGGQLIFEEAGGIITDLTGKPFDFTAGIRLESNYGLIAAPALVHNQVLKAVQEILSSSSSN
ncbi:hypothetical protein ACHAQJ_010504 [Trichoderma viride]